MASIIKSFLLSLSYIQSSLHTSKITEQVLYVKCIQILLIKHVGVTEAIWGENEDSVAIIRGIVNLL